MSTEFKNEKIGYYVHSKALSRHKHSEMECCTLTPKSIWYGKCCFVIVVLEQKYIKCEHRIYNTCISLKSDLLNEYLKIQNWGFPSFTIPSVQKTFINEIAEENLYI